MNKIDKFKENIRNKNIAVIGAGVSNIPAIIYLKKLGANVCVLDKNINLLSDKKELQNLNIDVSLGEEYLKILRTEKFDYVLRSPGVKPFIEELEIAKANGAIITSEMELFISLCPCKILAITGSDGKTTTTTLVSEMLKDANKKVFVGGNIGMPLLDKVEEIQKEDIVVLELSSFQLMTFKDRINVAGVTNISPNHLDYHRSYDEYIEAKENIFKGQTKEDVLVLNLDDKISMKRFKENAKTEQIRFFSLKESVENGAYLDGKNVVLSVNGKQQVITSIDKVKLVGMHNIANICMAASIVIDFVTLENIKHVAENFTGVKHRMEHIRTVNDVKYYNDSIASSPTRTIAGLKAFDDKVILIAGGYDKNIPYDEIGSYIVDKVKSLLLIGKTAPKIKLSVIEELKRRNLPKDYLEIKDFDNLEDAVLYAKNIAKPFDKVVMSPASASFDLYKNFEERGEHFRKIVNAL